MAAEIIRLDEIKYISSVVSDWVKHLETKNGVLLVFLSGILALTVTLKGCDIISSPFWAIFSVLTIISSFIVIYSFVPRINPKQNNSVSKVDLKSVVFFGEIAKVTMNDYKKYLINTLSRGDGDDKFTDYEAMIISDIWNNSRVAVIKSRCFKWSLIIFSAGSVIIVILHLFGVL